MFEVGDKVNFTDDDVVWFEQPDKQDYHKICRGEIVDLNDGKFVVLCENGVFCLVSEDNLNKIKTKKINYNNLVFEGDTSDEYITYLSKNEYIKVTYKKTVTENYWQVMYCDESSGVDSYCAKAKNKYTAIRNFEELIRQQYNRFKFILEKVE